MGPVKGKTSIGRRQKHRKILNLTGRLTEAEEEVKYLEKVMKDPKLPKSLKKLFHWQLVMRQLKADTLKRKLEEAEKEMKEDEQGKS
jgi:hypothetical protein